MRRIGCVVAMVAVLISATGCSEAMMAAGLAGAGGAAYIGYRVSKPAITAIVTAAGREAAGLGLRRLSPAHGQIAAGELLTASERALKYLRDNPNSTGDATNQAVTELFSALNSAIIEELDAVSATLGRYVPISAEALKAAEVECLTAFIRGMEDGARAYLANPGVTVAAKYSLASHENNLKRGARVGARRWFAAVK